MRHDGAVSHWLTDSAPAVTIGGQPLPGLEAVELWRMTQPLQPPEPEEEETGELVADDEDSEAEEKAAAAAKAKAEAMPRGRTERASLIFQGARPAGVGSWPASGHWLVAGAS